MPGKHDETTAGSPVSAVFRSDVRVRQLALVIHNGIPATMRLTLGEGGATIGREPSGEAIVRLDDSEASRQHTRVEPDQDGQWRAIDCGSRNGTIVDGNRASPNAPLRDGSVLRIGRSLFVFVDKLLPSSVRLVPESAPLWGPSLPMQRVRGEIALSARSSAPVLVLGESGTGKELAASELHAQSGRKGEFVAVNCASIPAALAEAELFGHVAGAFTGATRGSEGMFAAADGGTLFLDEIGELDASVQAKLLRVLATGERRPLGRAEATKVDVRVVAATHRDLEQHVAAGIFRGDLFARLSASLVRLPPLRERRDDVVRIATAFLTNHFPGVALRVSAAEALTLFDWPYNVRELENVLRAAAARAGGEIRPEHLPEETARGLRDRATRAINGGEPPIELVVARDATPDAPQLAAVLRHFDGNLSQVAAYFQRDRKQIYRWAERLGVDLTRGRSAT